MAAAMSAVIGTRKIRSGIPQAVYLTGNKWNDDVRKFQLPAEKSFGMKDYNSSDVILRYGNTFVGISLKKKPSAVADSPTLINNCLLYTSPSPRDKRQSRMPSSA